ncbi:hypothetical protein DKX38_012108 [Salix brachista]|uniref:SnoaL-like domain-containing protein n=1 Tax=Salix brachista TaxID=2182728 RepID=A0A5N5LPW4_9ROSI|nr:hypothetical protein DKX38_012108 [Salix brachista]
MEAESFHRLLRPPQATIYNETTTGRTTSASSTRRYPPFKLSSWSVNSTSTFQGYFRPPFQTSPPQEEPPRPTLPGACEYKPGKPVSDDIIPHILNLYGSCATPRDFEIYAPNASFEDPLMCAHGVKQIKSAFYSISKVFSESRIVEYSVEQKAKSAGKQEILINSKQHYKFLGRNIDLISLIKLYVEDGKVVRHEDWWYKKPIGNRETIKFPLVGHLMERLRRGSMLATHSLMGFGKDPST